MENGQAGTRSMDHLDHCCRLVSETYGKPDISAWTNSDYIRLGYILYKKTSVQISPNTLKRIFGKIRTDVRYYPQRATRDALAQYVGFKDWEKFTYSVQIPERKKESLPVFQEPTVHIETVNSQQVKPIRRIWPVAIMALAILIAGFAAYKHYFTEDAAPQVTMVCNNPVGENPHSAAFVLHGLPTTLDAHYVIDFGDGRKTSVVQGDSLYSHYYEVPGRYLAVLKRGEAVLDTVSVFLKTSGWTATAEIMHDTTRVYPIEVSNLFNGKKNSVSAAETSRAGVDTNRTFFVKFVNTQVTDIDGDNFDLFIKLKTSDSRPGVRCSQVRVTVFGETSKHYFDVMKPGCTHWTDMQFSEIVLAGELNQLNFLGADLHQGGTLALSVKEKHARVLINSKQVYETDYQKPLKKIYGLGITFSGIGAVESVELKDAKTGKFFGGNFPE